MRQRSLGRTGLLVSELGHGLWGMGSWLDSDDDRSIAALTRSRELGCTFYDTAWAYGDGLSDRLLGRLLSDLTGDLTDDQTGSHAPVAASKIPPANLRFPASPTDSYRQVFPKRHVLDVAERIRDALGVDRIPLLQLHVWDDSWLGSEFLDIAAELRRDGLIEHFGLSLNRWEPWNGIRAVESGLVDTVQVIYNIFDQAPEDELFPACRQHDVGVIARVPLDEGSLGGRLTLATEFPPGDWRARYFGPENLPPTVRRVERLRSVLPAGMTLPELALRFVISNPDVSTVIVGMRAPEHVEQNAAAVSRGPLPEDLIDALREHRWDRKVTAWAN